MLEKTLREGERERERERERHTHTHTHSVSDYDEHTTLTRNYSGKSIFQAIPYFVFQGWLAVILRHINPCELLNVQSCSYIYIYIYMCVCVCVCVAFNKFPDFFAWIEHQFLSGIRDSRKAGSLWEIMRGVGGVRNSKHQSWLAKELGLGLLCWGFKGVQEEIPWKEASTLQIRSVVFPPGQCTSSQLHPCHRLFDQDGHQDSSLASQ